MIRRGMTITELLVVLMCISVLTALSVLAFSGVRTSGRSVSCLSHLRQLTLAAQQYALEYDYFPASIRYERQDGVLRQVAWDWVTSFDGKTISPGGLWEFTDHPDKILQCPEYHGPAGSESDPFTGYNYNTTYLGGEAPFPQLGWSNYRYGVTYSQCSRADRCVIFGDGGWAGGANKFMRAPENSEGHPLSIIYAGGQAYRHRNTTNAAYVDGHVEKMSNPSEGALATAQLLAQFMDHPRNGFLSNDDRAYKPR